MATYKKKVEEDDEPRAVALGPMPCSFCGQMTDHGTLRMFGARCTGCYDAYCKAMPPKHDCGPEIKGNPKAWAHYLKWRESAGESLSYHQKRMWLEALGETELPKDSADDVLILEDKKRKMAAKVTEYLARTQTGA